MNIKFQKAAGVFKICFFIIIALIITLLVSYILSTWLPPVNNFDFLELD